MNKSTLVNCIADKSGLSEKQAAKTLHAVLTAIADGVKSEGHVVIPGFGSFKKIEKPARQGYNPATSQMIHIPAKAVVKFKAGKELEF